MGRPKLPLVDRREAISKALDIIDRDGLDALSLRRLGTELGVSGAALYHHFTDKNEILRGVVGVVLAKAVMPPDADGTWDEIIIASTTRFRRVLLSHPNAAPLLVPGSLPTRAVSDTAREFVAAKMLADGVPEEFWFPIIDSAEMLALGSAMTNPRLLPPNTQPDPADPDPDSPARSPTGSGLGPTRINSADTDTDTDRASELERIIAAADVAANRVFELELTALMRGWKALIHEAPAANGG
ncbi:TetR family transcriptional regulator [Frankia sp. AiPs1]|uniref:TetR/AcrR family transcriptional regulator n=1 Tax=Frankia sp. AiPa1 TaxID=573492 RepID=UPI0027E5A214|nr:TetR family transcriptional regulator [Frankia sp. AiPa1]